MKCRRADAEEACAGQRGQGQGGEGQGGEGQEPPHYGPQPLARAPHALGARVLAVFATAGESSGGSVATYPAIVAEVHDGGEAYTLDWEDGDDRWRRQPAANVQPEPQAAEEVEKKKKNGAEQAEQEEEEELEGMEGALEREEEGKAEDPDGEGARLWTAHWVAEGRLDEALAVRS